MSHFPERKQKNCLNCGTHVLGKFCHICGQENIEPKETVWHLLNHFFSDVTHFDGKFFSSLHYLITRPGFLSKEYFVGRRARYLNPIRMYLFTSAIFFLVFFSILKFTPQGFNMGNNYKPGSIRLGTPTKNINGLQTLPDTLKTNLDSNNFSIAFSAEFKSKQEYDSLLKAGARNDNWFMKKLIHKSLDLNTTYKNKPSEFFSELLARFVHTFPQMLFVLLPMFALILKLLYVRKKEYYYTDHLIFTLHFYIFIFIAMLAIFGINKIENILHWHWLVYISAALTVSLFFYFYKSLRNFYLQGRAKTIIKYILILFLLLFILIILFSAFFLLSFFQI